MITPGLISMLLIRAAIESEFEGISPFSIRVWITSHQFWLTLRHSSIHSPPCWSNAFFFLQ